MHVDSAHGLFHAYTSRMERKPLGEQRNAVTTLYQSTLSVKQFMQTFNYSVPLGMSMFAVGFTHIACDLWLRFLGFDLLQLLLLYETRFLDVHTVR